MTDHYYTPSPNSKSNPSETSFYFKGHLLFFETDHGVFSKGTLDKGSEILLHSLPTLNGTLLDLGCGWGPIGISLKKAFPSLNVTMVDINTRATELAQKNALKNHVTVDITSGDGFSSIDNSLSFHTIVTNPPIRAGKKVIYQWFKEAYNHLYPNGMLYLVIRKQQGAPSAVTYLQSIFSKVAIINKEKGYWIISCEK